MTATERAADVHCALVSLYRRGVPLDGGLRPFGSADARVAVAVADAGTGEAIAARLRGAPGIAEAMVVAGPGHARLEIVVAPELARAALEGLLGRPPVGRGSPPRQEVRSTGTRPEPQARAEVSDSAARSTRQTDEAPAGRSPARSGAEQSASAPAELIAAAQLAHARAHRHLRRAARLHEPQAASTGPPPVWSGPVPGPSGPPPVWSDPAPGPSGRPPALPDAAPGPRAGHLLAVLADQPRVLGPNRITNNNPRALTEHLRALTRATDRWLDERQDPAGAGELRLTQGALRALGDALHTLDEPAPARC